MTKKKMITKPEIEILNDYSHSRLRTEMFLGSRDPHTQIVMAYENGIPIAKELTWVPALFTAYREVLDNAVDELITHKGGDRLDIKYNESTMEISIKDNGRGIPIDIHPQTGTCQATAALSMPKAGRNFNDDERGASRGLNGVGASIVNFCSEWFKVDICRDKKSFSQCFSEGKNDTFQIDDPVILPASKTVPTGTQIRFKLSKKVFKHMILPEEFIRDRAFEIALCYPLLKVYYNGTKINTKGGADKTLFGKAKPICFDIEDENFESKFWLVPNFFENKNEHAHSLVNGIPMFNGGTHIDAFRRNFYNGVLKVLERESKRRKLSPNRSDLADGMLLYNITEMDAPAFDSQSKSRLINEPVAKIINNAMSDDFFKTVVRKNAEWIETVYQRCSERTQKKDAADITKLNKSNKRLKVEKLVDAASNDRKSCILFLTEGDCLHENTEIVCYSDDGNKVNKKIKNVKIGDLVLSHTNRICRVTATANKVSQITKIKTSYGDISASPKHRLLCHNRSNDKFEWVEVGNIDKKIHRLVRNRTVDVKKYAELISNEEIEHELYKRKITFIDNETGNTYYEYATNEHSYGVFNLDTMVFEKVKSSDLEVNTHVLLI